MLSLSPPSTHISHDLCPSLSHTHLASNMIFFSLSPSHTHTHIHTQSRTLYHIHTISLTHTNTSLTHKTLSFSLSPTHTSYTLSSSIFTPFSLSRSLSSSLLPSCLSFFQFLAFLALAGSGNVRGTLRMAM